MMIPFFHLLKNDEKFIWDEKYQRDLDNIKRYITNPLVLAPYDSKRSLLLYVSTTMNALGVMLAQKDDNNKKRVIYYINRLCLNMKHGIVQYKISPLQ